MRVFRRAGRIPGSVTQCRWLGRWPAGLSLPCDMRRVVAWVGGMGLPWSRAVPASPGLSHAGQQLAAWQPCRAYGNIKTPPKPGAAASEHLTRRAGRGEAPKPRPGDWPALAAFVQHGVADMAPHNNVFEVEQDGDRVRHASIRDIWACVPLCGMWACVASLAWRLFVPVYNWPPGPGQ